MDDKKLRYAVVGSPVENVRPYMPANYDAHELDAGRYPTSFLVGADVAGWTLEDYVIPRLASGLHFAREVTREELEELGAKFGRP